MELERGICVYKLAGRKPSGHGMGSGLRLLGVRDCHMACGRVWGRVLLSTIRWNFSRLFCACR